ncbi:MAG: response regulator transcription factor [Elusimicrobia bacterium]|nr:response regulator transcription factor [Elusimicrobiota bacterium]
MACSDNLKRTLGELHATIEAYMAAFRADAAAVRALDELRRLSKAALNELSDAEEEECLRDMKGPRALTSRELEILTLIVAGLANKEIAYRLGISDRTVQFHIRSIFDKTGARSRTEAAVLAVKNFLPKQKPS